MWNGCPAICEGRGVFLFSRLFEVHAFVVAFAAEEFLGCSVFDDAAVVEDEDLVDVADGGQAVGDDDGGAVLHEFAEAFDDKFFVFDVEGAGGFV